MGRRYYSSSAADTALAVSVTAGATSIEVGSITGHPVQYPYTLILDPETPSEEVVDVTAGTGTTLTVTRGVDGTTALAHTTGAVVRHGVSARDYDEPNQHIEQESNVHGVTGDVVGTQGAQALTDKDLSDESNSFPPAVTLPAGMVAPYAGSSAPTGWLLADGSEVSRSTYADLFNAIGETHGAGNGSTTFNLPNMKGKVPVGLDASQSEFNALAGTGGAKTHTLTTGEMPSHGHGASSGTESADHAHSGSTSGVGDHTHGMGLGDSATIASGTSTRTHLGSKSTGGGGAHSHTFSTGGRSAAHTHSVTVDNTGDGGAHNNLQPYVVLNYIIKH